MKSRFRVSDEPEYVGRCETIYSNPYEGPPHTDHCSDLPVLADSGVDVIRK